MLVTELRSICTVRNLGRCSITKWCWQMRLVAAAGLEAVVGLPESPHRPQHRDLSLDSIARSKPTAFQAVSFQQVSPLLGT
jgi:hypothetical protein